MRQRVWTDLSEALSQRSYVYHLDLSRQHLKLLPAEIGKLNKVETCALAENDLSGLSICLKSLIAHGGIAVACQRLFADDASGDVSETSLPEEFFDLDRLRELDISYNRFKTLPACICSFIDLEKINITGTFAVRGMYVMSLLRGMCVMSLLFFFRIRIFRIFRHA